MQPGNNSISKTVVMILLLLLFAISCGLGAAQSFSAGCTDTSYGKSCRVRSEPFILKVFDNTVLVGMTSYLEVYALDLEHSSVFLPVQARAFNSCRDDGFTRTHCDNHVSGIEIYSESLILVCSSNANQPQCRLHQRNMLGNSMLLLGEESPGAGYSFFGPAGHPVPATFIASNDHFYTIAQFAMFSGQELLLRMAPNFRQGNFTFVVTTPFNNNKFFYADPNVLSIHEVGEHIYIYFTELALEVLQTPTPTYSRVARVCKNDFGIHGQVPERSMLAVFLTFEKARITCQEAGSSFVYNVMLGASTDTSPDGMPVVYGTFNAPLDGPPGGILCKISFDSSQATSVPRVFLNQDFTVQNSIEDFITDTADSPVNCPGSGTQRTEADARRFILHSSIVTADPVIARQTTFLDKIATEVIQHQRVVQEIIFFTNLRGDIRQIIRSNGINHEQTLYTAPTENQVRHLVLYRYAGSRNLIATTSSQILQFIRGRCYCYTNCFTCLESKDPYCGWDMSILGCISKLAYNDTPIIEAFSASEQDVATVCDVQESPSPQIYPCSLQPFDTVVTQEIVTTSEETTAVPTSSPITDVATTTTTKSTDATNSFDDSRVVPITGRSQGKIVADTFTALASGIVTALVLLMVGIFIPILKLKRKGKKTTLPPFLN